MKIDYIIGNPPYQIIIQNTSDEPIYNLFMNDSYKLSANVALITPAKFLFGAGKNLNIFTKERLSDKDFMVYKYWAISDFVFPNNNIMGGIVITYRRIGANFGAIHTFYAFQYLKSIHEKIYNIENNRQNNSKYTSLSNIVYSPESYRFTQKFHDNNPTVENKMSKGHKFDFTSNIFDKLNNTFLDTPPINGRCGYLSIYGIMSKSLDDYQGKHYIVKYINKEWVRTPNNCNAYKVFLSKSYGASAIGEKSNTSIIGKPFVVGKNVGHTQTFLSIGKFDTEKEAVNCMKYIKTKFVRALIGICKVTQHNKSRVWKYVPMQNFTDISDIDWNKSIEEINIQLYDKYNLTEEERAFINSNIKEMI